MITILNRTSDLTNYRKQVIGFSQTLTIKYEPSIKKINDTLLYNYPTKRKLPKISIENIDYTDCYYYDDSYADSVVVGEDLSTWKYYRNMQGEYHWSDDIMTITSLDTGKLVVFCKKMLREHNKTRTFYKIDSEYYTELCNRFPYQVDLIKNILYPVLNVQYAIASKNLTILGYDDTSKYLENTERNYIVENLRLFLQYLDEKWYFAFLSNEQHFHNVFLSMVWYLIPNIIYMYRVKAIKTSNVHSWHIWQNLTSHGLDDYSDILSRSQSMFLYRNIDYITQNSGKQSTLNILIENLLSSLSIGIYGRDIYEETITKKNEARLTAEFVPLKIPNVGHKTDNSVTTETVETMNNRLYYSNLEKTKTKSWVEDLDRSLGDVKFNTTATKFLELKMIENYKKYIDDFNMFVIQTLVYCANKNIYNPIVDFIEPLTGAFIALSVKECLVLYNYTMYKIEGQTTENIPKDFLFTMAYKQNKPKIPMMYSVHNTTYNVNSFIDLNAFMKYASYPERISTPEEFSNFVTELFLSYMYQRYLVMSNSDYTLRNIGEQIYLRIHEFGRLSINLTNANTYSEWFSENTEIYDSIINRINSLNNADVKTNYDNLQESILSALIPTTPIMEKYGDFNLSNLKYERLKQLFVQLTSYNITFLNTSGAHSDIVYAPHLSFYPTKMLFIEKTAMPLSIVGVTHKEKLKTRDTVVYTTATKLTDKVVDKMVLCLSPCGETKDIFNESISYSYKPRLQTVDNFKESTNINTTIKID